ncbi:MAG: hypothetical protein ABIA37_05245 [Candidatus Woesearchaeota archaeon]
MNKKNSKNFLGKLFLGVLFLLMVMPIALAAITDDPLEGTDRTATASEKAVQDKVMSIVDFVIWIAGGIGVLLLVITGIMFMQAGDPSDKKRMGDRLKMILLGLVLVILAKPIIQVIMGA